ncbi:MAG: PTS sugar transporter subunit IIA, partial [Exiguobacterium acetylicum]
SDEIQLEDLIAVIKQHATIQSESALRQELNQLLYPRQPKLLQGGQPVLNDLITTNQIQIHQRVESWMDAIRVAASPLLLEKKIQPAYIETMIQNVESHGPYIVLMPDVAIPHARPEDGVLQLGMSILKLEEPVLFPQDKEVRLFFVLAAIDQTTHLKALSQLTNLLGNQADVTRLLEASSVTEIETIIEPYSEED